MMSLSRSRSRSQASWPAMSSERWTRAVLAVAFGILVLAVAFLGWQIERGIEHNLRANCSVMAGQVIVLQTVLGAELAEDRIDAAYYARITDRAHIEFDAICGLVDRDSDGNLDPL